MNRAITWRPPPAPAASCADAARSTSSDVVSIRRTWANAVPRQTYVLVDHIPTRATASIAKGRYRILPSHELVTCDHPDAP